MDFQIKLQNNNNNNHNHNNNNVHYKTLQTLFPKFPNFQNILIREFLLIVQNYLQFKKLFKKILSFKWKKGSNFACEKNCVKMSRKMHQVSNSLHFGSNVTLVLTNFSC